MLLVWGTKTGQSKYGSMTITYPVTFSSSHYTCLITAATDVAMFTDSSNAYHRFIADRHGWRNRTKSSVDVGSYNNKYYFVIGY